MSTSNPMGSGGAMAVRGYGRTPVALTSLQSYNPNRANQIESIWQPFYDTGSPLAAGVASSFPFFQVGFGQGTTPKNYTQTNMPGSGSFPAPTTFLCTAIMINFLPGQVPSVTGAAARALNNWNDVIAMANAGYVEFSIGGKIYLRDAPMGKFAPNYTINGVAALATTVATTNTDVNYARSAGRYYEITPFLIPQTQNFSIVLYYPTAPTITANGTLICTMDGFYYRQSQ